MSDYEINRFYTRSTDKRGHHSSARVTGIPPELNNAIGALIASRRIPEYRTVGDFIRDAIVHRLHYIENEMDLELAQTLDNWRTVDETAEEVERMQRAERLVEGMQEIAYRVRTGNNPGERDELGKRISAALALTTLPAFAVDQLQRILHSL